MQIIPIASGSTGNCYIYVANNGRKILLDCGVGFKKTITKSEFGWLTDYEFVFVSHKHQDHARAMKDFEKTGVRVISYLNPQLKPTKVGQFIIKMFPLQHNTENYGIIIVDTLSKEKFCYATDFITIPHINGLDAFLMEINCDLDIINERIVKDGLNGLNSGFNWHFSLQQAEELFKNYPKPPKELIICHISKDNAQRKKILEVMQKYVEKVRIV